MGVTQTGTIKLSPQTVVTVLERHARDAGEAAGRLTAETAQRLAPAARVHRRGPGRAKRLKDNMPVRVRANADGVQVTVGPNPRETFYARFLEDGTVQMDARPYMEPARLLTEAPAERLLEDGAARGAAELERRIT